LSGVRRAQPARSRGELYASRVEPAALCPALPVSAEAAPTASVPLFKVHCSFLI
jgi:hypothetical protein